MSGAVRELAPPGERLDRVPERPEPPRASQGPRGRPPWAFVVAGVAVVLLVVGFVTLEAPTPDDATPTSSVPNTMATPVEPAVIDLPQAGWARGLEQWSNPPISWKQVTLPTEEWIGELASNRGTVVGRSIDWLGSSLWWTSAGTTWAMAEPVEDEDGVDVLVSTVTDSGDGFLAIGQTEWVSSPLAVLASTTGGSWTVTGIDCPGCPESSFPADVASSGAIHVVLADSDAGQHFIVGDGAPEWHAVPVPEGASVTSVQFVGGTFVASGSRCDETRCAAAIWTSTYGYGWEQKFLQLPDGPSDVVGVAAISDGWAAAGSAGSNVVIWTSRDAELWTMVEAYETLFRPPSVTVALRSVELAVLGPRATVVIDGRAMIVGRGDHLGDWRVADITDGSVIIDGVIQTGSGRVELAPGDTFEAVGTAWPSAIVGFGDRILVIGSVFGVADSHGTAVVWTSADRGRTWVGSLLPNGHMVSAAVDLRGRPLVTGSGVDGSPVAWTGWWDTSPVEADITAAVQRFLVAVSHGISDAAAASLPARSDDVGSRIVWPSPVASDLGVWYGADVAKDGGTPAGRIAAAVAYGEALAADVRASGCVANAPSPDERSGSVTCRASYTDDLVNLLVGQPLEVWLTFTVERGAIVDIAVGSAAGEGLWERFTNWMDARRPDDAVATLRTATVDNWFVRVPSGADAAAVHLAAAQELVDEWLEPGETWSVPGPLGTLEWAWATVPEGADEPGVVTTVPDGFAMQIWSAAGREETWVSADGLTWVLSDRATPGVDTGESVAATSPIGPIFQVWDRSCDCPRLQFERNGVLLDVPFGESPVPPDVERWFIGSPAADEDMMLLRTVWSVDEFTTSEQRYWRWDDQAGALVPFAAPWAPSGEHRDVEFALSSSGAYALVDGFSVDGRVWRSIDAGRTWESVLEGETRGLVLHRLVAGSDQVVVVGEMVDDEACREFEEERNQVDLCSGTAAVAVSRDGQTWDVVIPGESVSSDDFSQVTCGGLGCVAWGWGGWVGSYDPSRITLWLSSDGVDWTRLDIEQPWVMPGQPLSLRESAGILDVLVGDHALLVSTFGEAPGHGRFGLLVATAAS